MANGDEAAHILPVGKTSLKSEHLVVVLGYKQFPIAYSKSTDHKSWNTLRGCQFSANSW